MEELVIVEDSIQIRKDLVLENVREEK